MKKERIIGLSIVLIFAIVIAYFFISTASLEKWELPSYVDGDMREVYEWAKTEEGMVLLKFMPCYCGCKYEGHRNTMNCYWTDEGKFDKHGVTCTTCFDIATKTRKMHEEGKSLCEIRNDIDAFYAPNKHLGTETPMPPGCEAP